MYKYRVISWITTGNAKKLYDILDLKTGEILHKYAAFFKEQGDDAFINVSVRNNNFSILKYDKGTPEYEVQVKRIKTRSLYN